MTNSSGNLSVDFLVGFTIFMVAFIWVATLVPNLFLGVSSHEIDFDAVAYRTGVILAEDPGATIPTVDTPWEFQPDSGKRQYRTVRACNFKRDAQYPQPDQSEQVFLFNGIHVSR